MPTALKRPLDPKIKELLQRQGLPDLAALSRKIQRYQGTVNRTIFDNKLKDLQTYQKLAQALKVDIDMIASICLDFDNENSKKLFDNLMKTAQIATLYRLSRLAGLDTHTVEHIYNGVYQCTQLKLVRDIARGLGCSLAALCEILLIEKPLLTQGLSDSISESTNALPYSATRPISSHFMVRQLLRLSA